MMASRKETQGFDSEHAILVSWVQTSLRCKQCQSAPAMVLIPHLLTLADLTGPQIRQLVSHSHRLKHQSLPWLQPKGSVPAKQLARLALPSQSLFNKTIALLFSKRSTRTRIAAETSASLLGGRALFLGQDDIQLGVNETPRDTARVIGGMCQGIFARVGGHEEIEVSAAGCIYISFIHGKTTGTSQVFARPRLQRSLFPLASNTNFGRLADATRACSFV